MADRSLGLLIQSLCDIPQAISGSNTCNARAVIHDGVIDLPQINAKMSIFAPQTMRGIAVPSGLGIDLKAQARGARHGRLHLGGFTRRCESCGRILEPQVERLDGSCPLSAVWQDLGYIGCSQAICKSTSLRKRSCREGGCEKQPHGAFEQHNDC